MAGLLLSPPTAWGALNGAHPCPTILPSWALLQALVERYLSVEVEGLTPEGLPIKLAANGWKARILQHECDHLAGVLVRRST
jgi:hypothetical protein